MTDTASMLGKLLPELAMLATLLMFAHGGIGPTAVHYELLLLAMLVDGASLMCFSTLIDIATRLRRSPPWWLVLLIGAGVLAAYPDVWQTLMLAWHRGLWVFLPFAWSVGERIREMWTLPGASDLEKIRRRTLVFDRLYVGVAMMVVWVAVVLAIVATSDVGIEVISDHRAMIAAGVAFYSVAAFNVWRVHRPAFATRPRSLLPGIDKGEGARLDSL